MMPKSIAAAIIFLLDLLATPANAQVIKTCAGVEVQSLSVTVAFARNALPDTKPSTIDVSTFDPLGKAVSVVALGPILGSMDSPKIETEFSCTTTGLILVATISRSEHFNGIVGRNQNWRPRITMAVNLRASEQVLKAIWKMVLTNGKEVTDAQTPPYPERHYPITVTKTIRSEP